MASREVTSLIHPPPLPIAALMQVTNKAFEVNPKVHACIIDTVPSHNAERFKPSLCKSNDKFVSISQESSMPTMRFMCRNI